MKTEKTENTKKQTDPRATSERRCAIEGKHFLVTRHFHGEKPLSVIMAELAISRANREMGI